MPFCFLCSQDYIQRLMAEKADLDKRFHGMKDELITRLQNACAQRDEARAQVRVQLGFFPGHTLCSFGSAAAGFTAFISTVSHLYC